MSIKRFFQSVFSGFAGSDMTNKKKRKSTRPSERPKNVYSKAIEHGLYMELLTGDWSKDQRVWRSFYAKNKSKVLIELNRFDLASEFDLKLNKN